MIKKNKKRFIFIILITLLIIAICSAIWIFKDYFSHVLIGIILKMAFIIGIVCVPLIILAVSIFKKQQKAIIISVIILLIIYSISGYWLVRFAIDIITDLSTYSVEELFNLNQKQIDTSYLENYRQKLAKNGYLERFDIVSILDIADSKSDEIRIYYKDENSNIDMYTTNKDDNQMQNLKDSLKANYYTYHYNVDNDEIISIYIDRYLIDQDTTTEKNSSIILTGEKNSNIISLIDKYYVDDNYENYYFKNKININKESEDTELDSFNMLLVYDDELENYIPVTEDTNQYEFIDSYNVYSYGIEITLKSGVTLTEKDYTLRLNRYDDTLNVNNTSYYYEYEPVVTELTDSDNRIVLEIRFDRTYSLSELKNIEIIFG